MNTWLNELLTAAEVVIEKSAKFYDKGNATAGSDARKALQDLRVLAKTGRKDIQATKTSRKVEKGTAKSDPNMGGQA